MGAFDVVVVGGGPGGSVCGAQLARRGLSVLVLEREQFPRFHLGESLLPQSLPVLADLGVLPEVEATFQIKHGARFHDDVRHRQERFVFADAWKAEPDHAFQVPRDAFDAMLLRHASRAGAEVRERMTVTRILREEGRAVGVEAGGERIAARFVVDATGRDAITARELRAATKIEGLDQTALYAHYEGVPREGGEGAGDIDIVLFGEAGDPRPSWFWMIPFKDGRTSIGAVVSSDWIKRHRAAGADVTALLDAAIASSETASAKLAGARRLWPEARATADFSYRVASLVGDGWLAVGDAAGFIDPLFSTGAHLAMVGGKTAADAIADVLGSGDRTALDAWATSLRAASETFIVAVRSFYRGPLVDYLFSERKHVALRRSITSLLAGDVFHDAIWLRDTRRRLAALDQVSF